MTDLLDQLNKQKRRVDFDTFDLSVREIVGMVGDDLINIAPEYQRQFRWNSERESTFIESVFLGIPIPSIFMAANEDGSWELIDGVQRVSTLIHFVGNQESLISIGKSQQLMLTGLEKLSLFNGFTFDELSTVVKTQIILKPLKVITITDKSDFQVRFDLFERLNTGGILLTDQEIRACIYRGKFNDMLRTLSNNADFKSVVKLPREAESNGTREEHVLRFFSFLNCYNLFDHSVKTFLTDYMAASSKSFKYKANIELFENVFDVLAKALPQGITRGRQSTPVNLYEAIVVGAALALKKKPNINVVDIKDWMQSEELKSYTTGATNSKSMVTKRIHFARDRFLSK
ncbi:MAG: DUF262 domain-containing protein [Capsulimonas sp.]|uniref:DUF262 domain-containing protein n=1 Tax=Capsulimonas sp. TaxID=2494211 RepID=UPI003267ED85